MKHHASKPKGGAHHAPPAGRKGYAWMSVAHKTGEPSKRTNHFSRVGNSGIPAGMLSDDPSDPFGRMGPGSPVGGDDEQ